MDEADLEVLLRAADNPRMVVEIVVDACLYACCGRGWQERAGHEQTYRGKIGSLTLSDTEDPGGARLTAAGIGTVSYFVIFGFDHVLDVRAL